VVLVNHGVPHVVEGVGARVAEQWRAQGVGVRPRFPELEHGRGGGVAVDEIEGECGHLDLRGEGQRPAAERRQHGGRDEEASLSCRQLTARSAFELSRVGPSSERRSRRDLARHPRTPVVQSSSALEILVRMFSDTMNDEK
jgi:hypothetical protein